MKFKTAALYLGIVFIGVFGAIMVAQKYEQKQLKKAAETNG